MKGDWEKVLSYYVSTFKGLQDNQKLKVKQLAKTSRLDLINRVDSGLEIVQVRDQETQQDKMSAKYEEVPKENLVVCLKDNNDAPRVPQK